MLTDFHEEEVIPEIQSIDLVVRKLDETND